MKARGPTAARGALAALKWLQRHVGAVFHADSEEVARDEVDAPEHEEVPASLMSVKIWLLLEELLGSATTGDLVKLLLARRLFLWSVPFVSNICSNPT